MRRALCVLSLLSMALPGASWGKTASPPSEPGGLQCTANEANWTNPFGDAGAESGWTTNPGKPSRTETWSCQVRKNLLVVRFYYTHPVHACSAVSNVYVSVWVNGAKVLSREDAGEEAECNSGTALSGLMLRADGSMAVCRTTWPEAYAEEPVKECERLSAKKIARLAHDPKYVPPGTITPWVYDLHYGDAAFCAPYTGRLTLMPWRDLAAPDPAFAELAIPGTEKWMNAYVGMAYLHDENGALKYDAKGKPIEAPKPPLTAEFDADNDGAIDIVTLDNVQKKEGYVMAELRWQTKGASGNPFVAGEIFDQGDGIAERDNPYVTGYIAQLVRPVRIDAKTYVYARRHQAYNSDDGGEDLMVTEDNPKSLARGLIELHPDGKTTLKCGWGPRSHPEEFL